ncbi:MAG: glycosyltransferase family 4 protein [Leptolyngbya sp. SIO1E4]|nr:glycosyltransferase family 4 protein [Leptolyngbya sp. SIO1E4]
MTAFPQASANMSANASPRVSILVSDLSSSGAGRWAGAVRPFLLAQALQKAGYTPEIIGLSHESGTTISAAEIPIQVIQLEQGAKLWQSAWQLLNTLTGDLIYAYKLKPGSFGLALLHRLRHHKPVFLDIDDWELSWHGGDNWRYHPTPRKLLRDLLKPGGALRDPEHPLYLKWMQSLVAWADHITTHNLFLQQRFGGTYLPNGKDTHLFNPSHYKADAAREALGLSQYRVLMFPGAPRPYKGVEDVLAALDILNEPDLRLVIVGGSPYDDYDAYLHKHWGRWLIQLPKTSYTDMPSRIAAAHILVVPQRDDPATKAQFPLKITDGMAMAKPILATRVGDIPEILGDTGYLVDSDSPEALSTAIRRIFENYDEALEQGRRARLRCEENYSIECMSKILDNILKSRCFKQ